MTEGSISFFNLFIISGCKNNLLPLALANGSGINPPTKSIKKVRDFVPVSRCHRIFHTTHRKTTYLRPGSIDQTAAIVGQGPE